MIEFFNFFAKLFSLRLWVRTFETLVFSRKLDRRPETLNFGAQRFVVLAILLLACNVVYLGDTEQISATDLMSIIISGVAVLVITTYSIFLWCGTVQQVGFALNIVLTHILLTAAILLLVAALGIANLFDDLLSALFEFPNPETFEFVLSGSTALLVSSTVSVPVLINTKRYRKRHEQAIDRRVVSGALLVTLISAGVIYYYAMRGGPGVEWQITETLLK